MQPKILQALIPVSLLLGSCQNEDLEAAKTFGALAESLALANQTISADIYASCSRSATWEALGTLASRNTMKQQLEICDRLYRPNSENTEVAGSVLVNYVAAVGNLATENDSGFTAKLDRVSQALGNLNINGIKINENARTAGVQIANFITNILVRDVRRDNLQVAIVCSDPDIQEYSASLSAFIENSYLNSLLNREITQINENYGFYIGQVNRRLLNLSGSVDNPQDFNALQERQTLLEAEERAEINQVIERKKEGSAYIAAIRSTADFHGKLKQIFLRDGEEFSSEQSQICNEYFVHNRSPRVENGEQLRRSDRKNDSWNQEITASELKQAKQATKEYIDKVTPLLKEIED